MDRITALIAALENLSDATDEELAELEAEGLAIFDELRDGTLDDVDNRVAEGERIAGAVRSIQDEAGARIDAALAEAEAFDAIELARPDTAPDTAEGVTDAEQTDDAAAASEADLEPTVEDDEPAVEPEPVTASARPDLAALNAAQPANRRPVHPDADEALTADGNPHRVRVAPHIMGPHGEQVTDLARADALLLDTHRNTGFPSTASLKVPVLRRRFEYDEKAYLRTGDSGGNRAKVDALLASAGDPAAWVDEHGEMLPLTAAGQFCAPTEPWYEQPVLGETFRPMRDSLAGMGLDRGSIGVTASPVLSDILVDQAGGAIDTIDPSAGTSTKTIQEFVTCPDDQVVTYLEATSVRLRFDNFNAMTWNERQQALTQLAMVRAARHREQRLIAKMDALCTALTETLTLGAMPDILLHIRQILVSERLRLRLSPDYRFRVWLPQELIAAMQADVGRQMPGDGLARYNVTEAFVRSALSELGANLSVLQDDNVPGVQATGTLNGFQTVQTVRVAPEGTFMFGGGQELTLGVIRDSANAEDNTFETFEERFETLFRVGGWPAYRIAFTLCVTGGTAATVSTASDCEAS